MNPPPVYRPDNSLRPAPAQAKMIQPKIRPAMPAAVQLHAGNQMGPRHMPRIGSLPQSNVLVQQRPLAQPGTLAHSSPLTQQRSFIQQKLVQQAVAQLKGIQQQNLAQLRPAIQPRPGGQISPLPQIAHFNQNIVHGRTHMPGAIQRNALPASRFARSSPLYAANFNHIQRRVASQNTVIQPMSWVAEKVVNLGGWIIGHPIPKTFSALINLTDGIVSLVAVSLQTAGVAIAGSVTKLIQSINSAAKLAAQYSEEDDIHEKRKLKAQLVVECANILISIITLILATQGALAASVWTNAIATLLAKTSGEIYEVYCAWTKHQGEQALLNAV